MGRFRWARFPCPDLNLYPFPVVLPDLRNLFLGLYLAGSGMVAVVLRDRGEGGNSGCAAEPQRWDPFFLLTDNLHESGNYHDHEDCH